MLNLRVQQQSGQLENPARLQVLRREVAETLWASQRLRDGSPTGYGIGWGLVEAEGAIGVRMLSLQPEFTWNEAEMLARIRVAIRLRGPAFATGACRLVHGEADGQWGDVLVALSDLQGKRIAVLFSGGPAAGGTTAAAAGTPAAVNPSRRVAVI